MSHNSRDTFLAASHLVPVLSSPLGPHQWLWHPALTMPQPCSNTLSGWALPGVRGRLPSWQPRLSCIGPHRLARFTPLPTFPPAYIICHVLARPRLTMSLGKSFPSLSLSVWVNSKKAKNWPVDSGAVNGKLRVEIETTRFSTTDLSVIHRTNKTVPNPDQDVCHKLCQLKFFEYLLIQIYMFQNRAEDKLTQQ